jgi:hypothetical protein
MERHRLTATQMAVLGAAEKGGTIEEVAAEAGTSVNYARVTLRVLERLRMVERVAEPPRWRALVRVEMKEVQQ